MTKYPFKFLDAYNKEDQDIFFGRETEIDALYEMVFETNILFLYGASGIGKTSLLRCGLANRFKETHWSELFVLRGTNINSALLDAIHKNTPAVEIEEFDFSDELENTEQEEVSTQKAKNNDVVDALQELYRNTFNPIYLIFDQFEELFILGEKAEQQQFIQTVKDILQSDVPCKLLFSMREEYLANLYEFEQAVPQLLDKKLRVARMNYRNAQDIVLKATKIKDSTVHLEKNKEVEVANAIVDKIRDGRIEIQLPIFQMMMDSLYVRATGEKISRTKTATFDLKLLAKVGTIEDLLASFLNDRANMVYQSLNESFSDIPENFVWKFLSPFTTLEGTKVPLSIAEINQKLKKHPAQWLENCRILLEDNRILRYQEEGDLYSLMHDVLAKEVAKQKDSEQIAIETAERLVRLKFPIWMLSNQDEEKLLPKGDLAIIAPWQSQINLHGTEREFIQKSQTLADAELVRLKEEAEEEAKLRKKAEENELRARASEIKAKQSETEAKENELKARTSEIKAKQNEDRAKQSETEAKENEQKAKLFTRVAIGVMVVALILAGVALFQFFVAEAAKEAAKEAAEVATAEKLKIIAILSQLNIVAPDYFKEAVKAENSDENPLFQKDKNGDYDFDQIIYAKIEHLNFSGAKIRSIPEIMIICEKLQTLNLSNNKISDISFLAELKNLESLDLRTNKISDISFLEKLTNLESLYLSYNKISDISFLAELKSLQTLDLRTNKISDISFLEKLTNLRSLYLSGNQISGIDKKRLKEKLPNCDINF